MQHAAIHLPVFPADHGAVPEFNVVIAYEDYRAAERAKQAYDFLVANLVHEWRVSSQMWKFEVLGNPELREMAAKDAAQANLIIVSARGEGELPAEVKAWIELWLGCQGESVALVALFDCSPEAAEHAQEAQGYLEEAASRGRMEFFAWPLLQTQGASSEEGVPPAQSRDAVGEPLPHLAAVAPRQEPFTHWGINE